MGGHIGCRPLGGGGGGERALFWGGGGGVGGGPGGGGGGGVPGYDLGEYVPPGFPNLDPVLKKKCFENDTPF